MTNEHTDGSRSGGQPVVDREPIGFKNGRLMAQHDCYTLESNPHHAGTKAHADFVTAFTAVRTERLCNELDITNADHIALWLERNMGPSAISYLAVKIVEAHEAALRQTTQSDALRDQLLQECLVKLRDVQGTEAPKQYACNLIKRIERVLQEQSK